MVNQLKALITSMEEMSDHYFEPDSRQRKREITAILEKIDKTSPKNDDNTLANYVITIITLLPEIMQHPDNQAFESFCRQLNPSQLNLTESIHNRFYANPPKAELRKPRL